jgi:predicted DNA-binding ribbon-helix-helix protein
MKPKIVTNDENVMKKVNFSVRLYSHDFYKLKAIAAHKGLSYSTILTALIDDFNGEIVEVDGELKLVNLSLDKQHLDTLEQIAGSRGISTASVLRSMISQFLDRSKAKEYTIKYKITI